LIKAVQMNIPPTFRGDRKSRPRSNRMHLRFATLRSGVEAAVICLSAIDGGQKSRKAYKVARFTETGGGHIARSCRGRGHATRALAQLLVEAAANPEIDEVTAQTATGNNASRRVLQNNGFVKAGTRNDPEDGDMITWRRLAR
jgi:RimJ/RimL family protein N-acetyltransferase